MEGTSDRNSERCALASELGQVLDMVRQLEAHMDLQGSATGGELCRDLVSTMRASIDRSIHMAMSCCGEAGRPGAPESPLSADGSPGSAGSDHAAYLRCRGNAAGNSKKRKALPKWNNQVRVSSVQDVGPLDDGFSWRKYGQKDILGAKYPRAYFRCTHRHTQGCYASKQVQRTDGDPLLYDVVYHGNHTCSQKAQAPDQRPPSVSTEHAQSAQEQGSPAVKAEGLHVPETVMLSPFLSPPTGADNGSATGSCYRAGDFAAASPFVSPATSECQVSGGSYAAGGGPCILGATSTANSTVGVDMDFMLQLDVDFLDNCGYF